MFGLTTLGVVHTLIGLVAVVCGFWAVARDKEVRAASPLGRTYLVTTAITAITGLFIFQHGGFGPPHVLSILTLIALAVAALAGYGSLFGAASRTVFALTCTTTLLFHMIPAFTETLTRVPLGAPLLPSAEAPAFKAIYGVLFLLYGIGMWLQLRWLRGQRSAGASLGTAPSAS